MHVTADSIEWYESFRPPVAPALLPFRMKLKSFHLSLRLASFWLKLCANDRLNAILPRDPPAGRFGVVGGVMIESDDDVDRRFNFRWASAPLPLPVLIWLFRFRKITASVVVALAPPSWMIALVMVLLFLLVLASLLPWERGSGGGGWGLYNNQSL